ncbi:MAG: zinc-binding dehydrogenase [Candidatus Brocadiaceae bacterium]|jgi:threonine dehydrogenase-like Zn-dependent dehydrogenase
MKAVASPAPGKVEVVDIPPPEIADYECLVKVHACGLCNGTDLKIVDDHLSDQRVNYPVIIGHEGVGEVVEVGEKVKYIRPGDLFTNPIGRLAPGTPYTAMYGGMKELAVVQDHRAMNELGVDRGLYTGSWTRKVPSDMSPVEAAVLLTLKETYSGITNLGFRAGMDVLVYGDGPVGLCLVTFLRMRGAGWLGCVGHWDHRLEHVREVARPDLTLNSRNDDVEEAIGDRRVDLVIDAVGSTSVIKQGSRLLRSGGKVGVYGVLKGQDAELSLLDLKNNTSVHMLNWPVGEHEIHEQMLRMVQAGLLDLRHYYTHTMPADDVEEAVRLVRSREALKVIVTF